MQDFPQEVFDFERSNPQRSDPDMLNFERRFRERLHELSLKRRLLEESREQLEQALLSKHEIEKALDKEKRQLQHLQLQFEQALSAARRCEKELGETRNVATTHRLQLEATVRERDELKDRARQCQKENVQLKCKVEELEGQLKCHVAYQESSSVLQGKVRQTFEDVKSKVQLLEQDQRHLMRTVESARQLGSRLELATRHFRCVQKNSRKTRDQHEQDVVNLRAKHDMLQHNMQQKGEKENEEPPQHVKEWKASLREMEARQQAETEGSARLAEALNEALQAQLRFQSFEEEARKETEKLRIELENKQKYALALECKDRTYENNVHNLEEKIRLLEEQLQKPTMVDSEVQADLSLSETKLCIEVKSQEEEAAGVEEEEAEEKPQLIQPDVSVLDQKFPTDYEDELELMIEDECIEAKETRREWKETDSNMWKRLAPILELNSPGATLGIQTSATKAGADAEE